MPPLFIKLLVTPTFSLINLPLGSILTSYIMYYDVESINSFDICFILSPSPSHYTVHLMQALEIFGGQKIIYPEYGKSIF